MRLSGSGGELAIGGRMAARVGAWRAERGGDGWSIEATVTASNAYWLDRGAKFTLRLEAGRRVWRWRDVPKCVIGAELRLRSLGEPEGARYG